MGLYKILTLVFAGVTALGVVGSFILVAVKFISFLTKMNTNVTLIMTNHLPHIQRELEQMRRDFENILRLIGAGK